MANLNEFFASLNGGARWDVGVSINRSNSLPLDANSVFASKEAADAYAAGTPAAGTLANAYPGQVLAVVTEAETVIYYIDANMKLQPVGNTKDILAILGTIPEDAEAETIVAYIQELVDAVDGRVDTLDEDINGTEDGSKKGLKALVAEKVDKVEGKGLSTNDLTDTLKANYDAAYQHSTQDHAPAGAQANVIESIKVNGTALEIKDKSVDITVPTAVSQLTNDAGYLVANDIANKADKATTIAGYGITDAYTTDQVDEAIQDAKDYAKELVEGIPAQTDYTVTITETTTGLDDGIAKKYTFTQQGVEIGSINLAKELVVTAGSVKEVTTADAPYTGAKVGDKYIELVIANQDAPIYVPAKDLVDIYTAESNAAEVQLSINPNNVISATLTQAVKDEIAKAHTHDNADVLAAITSADVEAWDDAASKAHEHTNKDLLDTYTQTNDALATAVTNTHTHTFADSDVVTAIENSHTHANAALLDTYDQTNANIKAAVEATHNHTNSDVLAGITSDKVNAWDAAETNVIASVDATQLQVDTDRKLSIKAIDQALVAGLTDAAGAAITIAQALANKVEKNGTDRLITEDEAAKLELLVIDEETGQAAISGTVNANQVQGLTELLDKKVDKVEGMGLSANNLTDALLGKLNSVAENAQVNVIEQIKFNNTLIEVGEDKVASIVYALPIATAEALGAVKSDASMNKVSVENDGTMTVNTLSVSKLSTEGVTLILNGGNASA